MINILPVWESGNFGQNIRVRINGWGVNYNHPEFQGRFDVDGSCSVDEIEPDTTTDTTTSSFGTSVASIVGASASNGRCAVGIAPEATISACNVFADSSSGDISYSVLSNKLESFDISLNSFGLPVCSSDLFIRHRQLRGLQECPFSFQDSSANIDYPCDVCSFTEPTLTEECENSIIEHCRIFYEEDETGCLEYLSLLVGGDGTCNYQSLPEDAREAMETGVTQGRDGKGIIYVFPAGDGYALGEDVNFDGLTNSGLTISVGAVGKDGLHASYSTPGAAVLVSAPGGDREDSASHLTASWEGNGCQDSGVGTIFAAPVVAGVIALVLEANPDLTWREVQGILVSTSKLPFADQISDVGRYQNAATFTHSYLYGFGIVDADAAVDAAKTWVPYSPEERLIGESGLINAIIPDDSTIQISDTIILSNNGEAFIAESVEVSLSLQHVSRGDLEIILTSPLGTESILTPGRRPENTQISQDEQWKLLTIRSWGENAVGTWKLSITDRASCVDSPFETTFLGVEVNCTYLAQEAYCVDGTMADFLANPLSGSKIEELVTTTYDGRTLSEACCACGGGISRISPENILTEWKVVVRGQDAGFAFTPEPSPRLSPTTSPSKMPSTKPSAQPSLSPTTTPSSVPSHAPSVSSAPSLLPSNAPSVSHQPSVSSSPSQSPTRTPTIPVNKTKRLVNIIGSAFAVLLTGGTLYFVLRTPKTTTASIGDEFEANGKIV